MKSFIKNIVVFIALCLLAGCSENFLDENLDAETFPMGFSNIYISPDWESSGFMFMLSDIDVADYEIVSKPSWLNVKSFTGRISNGPSLWNAQPQRIVTMMLSEFTWNS